MKTFTIQTIQKVFAGLILLCLSEAVLAQGTAAKIDASDTHERDTQESDIEDGDIEDGYIEDGDILEAIEAEVRFDEVVSADTIDARVEAGVVTLSGTAFTLLEKRRAYQLIASLKGVRAIVDQLDVLPAGQTDEQVLNDVRAVLRNDPVADKDELQLQVSEGRVTLSGSVDSFPEKRLAETAIAGVRGVTEIDNEVVVVPPARRPDSEIQPEILRRFELSPFLAEGLVRVEVHDGTVALSGVVGSLNEKRIASSLSWVAGVRRVENEGLEVKWWLDRDKRRAKLTVLRNDVQLQRAVEDALLYDPRLQSAAIEVRALQGAVSLIGDVSSLAAKRAAEHDAKNTLGVRRVINNLKVKPPEWPGDMAVTEQAREALGRDAQLVAYELKASSHFGKLYLSGEVNTHFAKQRAEVVAANIPGALEVVNRIQVDAPWQPKPDDEIQEDVHRRLRWSPLLDADAIRVAVDDGVVTLRGTVDTWHERTMAARHAFQGGARRVVNQLAARSRRRTPAGLEATLIPKQKEYVLSPEYSGEAFRRELERGHLDPAHLPPPPEVDLVLKLSNTSTQPVDIRVGHDKGGLELSLTGEGAVGVAMGQSFLAEFRPGRIVTIAPGENVELPIRSLQYGFRNASDRWYWTEPGQYQLQATFTWPIDVTGISTQAVAATPVKLTVSQRQ